MSDHGSDNQQEAFDDWDDEAATDFPSLPRLRTFRVLTEDVPGRENPLYVQAHSVTCLDDAAHFYIYHSVDTPEGKVLAAYATRMLRPYLDVQDISGEVVVSAGAMN
jgi:hypothetical protein